MICITRGVQIESKGGKFLRDCDWIRRDKDRGRKVKAVLDWPVPKLVKDVQKFLGLANYYRRFVEEFAKIQGYCMS